MHTTNVLPQELEKFASRAEHWWDKNGEFKTLHDLNPLRVQWITSQATIAGQKVLDVGCGGGLLSEALAQHKAEHVTGIDLATASLQTARLHALENSLANISYQEIPVEQLAQENPLAFDVVSCMEMLEHVPNPESVVQACAQLLKPGGWAFFSTLNRHPLAFAGGVVMAEYILGLLPKGTHEYTQLIQPAELSAWARHAGLQVMRIDGVRYNPITRRAIIHADTRINYMLACRKPPF